MKATLKCWNPDTEKWIYEGEDDTEFSYTGGKWKVTYIEEITKTSTEGIEMDVHTLREVEEPEIFATIIETAAHGFYLSVPLTEIKLSQTI